MKVSESRQTTRDEENRTPHYLIPEQKVRNGSPVVAKALEGYFEIKMVLFTSKAYLGSEHFGCGDRFVLVNAAPKWTF